MAKPRGFSSGFSRGFGVGRYYYGLTQYQWVDDSWQLPAGVVGAVDLRTIPQMSIAGGAPQGFAFVASMQPIDVLIARSLHFTEENATGAMQDAWESELGYRPQGAKVVDLLWDALTVGADPHGDSGPKPLVPGTDMLFKLFLGGHSLVKRKKFRASEPEARPVLDMLRKQYKQLRRDSRDGKHRNSHGQVDEGHYRKCLDFWAKKYRLPHTAFIAGEPDEGTLPHETTVTDDFNRANEQLGAGAWLEVSGDLEVLTNEVGPGATGLDGATYARHTTSLSSDDHYAQLDSIGDGGTTANYNAPAVRMTGDTDGVASCYYGIRRRGSVRNIIRKRVSGTNTNLFTEDTSTPSFPFTPKLEIDGSTLAMTEGAFSLGGTDTAITGNLGVGINLRASSTTNQRGDNFSAADLAVAAGHPAMRRLIGHRPVEIGRQGVQII